MLPTITPELKQEIKQNKDSLNTVFICHQNWIRENSITHGYTYSIEKRLKHPKYKFTLLRSLYTVKNVNSEVFCLKYLTPDINMLFEYLLDKSFNLENYEVTFIDDFHVFTNQENLINSVMPFSHNSIVLKQIS